MAVLKLYSSPSTRNKLFRELEITSIIMSVIVFEDPFPPVGQSAREIIDRIQKEHEHRQKHTPS